jgi:hypothetical protein
MQAMKSTILGVMACVALGLSSAGAQELKATQKVTETQIGFDPGGTYSNYTLTVTGPNGFHASASSKSDVPAIDLRRVGTFDDGTYHYQLTASTDEKVPIRNALDNGRKGGADSMVRSVSTSGVFHVKGGAIMKHDAAAREPTNKRQK